MAFNEELFYEAEQFIRMYGSESQQGDAAISGRLQEIRESIEATGSYEHTYAELEYGTRVAWRNSNRCIGRLFWNTLKLFDERALQTEEEIVQALYRHIEYATNGGKIRPTITVFRQKIGERQIRIWNHQLIRYAGYETAHGILGDPISVEFTSLCESLGWEGRGTNFDVLPLVIQVERAEPKWFEIPPSLITEVDIRHPEFDWFADLQLKWYAVPIISDMELNIGGIQYTAAPFNGWYMETEIGARDLADEQRYNMLPKIASLMGLNTGSNSSLWKDKALVELNIAVLHSFQAQGVSIVDHHTAAKQFHAFEQNEEDCHRDVTGDWTWLIPPVSPATTHIFHHSYHNTVNKPNYFRQSRCPMGH